ncbi:hypothetical protein Noda2021_05040 [Candidatus Dependentiae bacterium Noda2021]|nr:hypothetical protein Noda2021_05040 [Candidatus Dependentiae bacterium Noda2021]
MKIQLLILTTLFSSFTSRCMQAPMTQAVIELNDHEDALLNLLVESAHLKSSIDNYGVTGDNSSGSLKDLMKKLSRCSSMIEKKMFHVSAERAEIIKKMSAQPKTISSMTELD